MEPPLLECGLDLVAHFSTTEHNKSEGMSLWRLGYKEAVASGSGAPSHALALLGAGCPVVSGLRTWRGPQGEELVSGPSGSQAPA